MALTLYAHPFSSYCQKVLIALYENGTPFTLHMLGAGDAEAAAELAALWPLQAAFEDVSASARRRRPSPAARRRSG